MVLDRNGSEWVEMLLHSQLFTVRERRAGAVSQIHVLTEHCV